MKSVVQYVLAHGRDLVATTQLAQSKIDLCECVPWSWMDQSQTCKLRKVLKGVQQKERSS